MPVQGVDGLLRLGVICHFHKAEAPRATGLLIGDHLGTRDAAVFLEQGQQVVGGHLPHEVADVNVLRHLKDLSVPIRQSELAARRFRLPTEGGESEPQTTRETVRGGTQT